MDGFPLFDLAIILVCLVSVTTLGLFLRDSGGPKNYFVGQASFPGWVLAFSIALTETGAIAAILLPGLPLRPGGSLGFLQLVFGILLGRILVAFTLLPREYDGDRLTGYQFLGLKFQSSVQKLGSGLFVVMGILGDGVLFFLSASFVSTIIGLNPGWVILITGLCPLLFVTLGGMRSIVWASLISFGLLTFGSVFLLVPIVEQMPGGLAQIFELGQQGGKFQIFQPVANTQGTTILSRFLSSFLDNFWLPAGIVGGAFLAMARHGSDQVMVQRYLCTKNKNEAKVALFGSGAIVLFQVVLYLFIGIGIYGLEAGNFWQPICEPEKLVSQFVKDRIPSGLIGLFLAGVLTATMTAIGFCANSCACAIRQDFVRSWFPWLQSETEAALVRWTTAGCILAQMFVALMVWELLEDQPLLEWYFSLYGFLGGLILGLFFLATMSKPVPSIAAISGLLVGGGFALTLWLPIFWGKPAFGFPWLLPLSAVSTWGFGCFFDFPRLFGKSVKK